MPKKSELFVDILGSVHAINWLRKRNADVRYGDETNLLATLETIRGLGSARLSQLAEQLSVDGSVVSRRVATLKRRGWVLGMADPADKATFRVGRRPASPVHRGR